MRLEPKVCDFSELLSLNPSWRLFLGGIRIQQFEVEEGRLSGLSFAVMGSRLSM